MGDSHEDGASAAMEQEIWRSAEQFRKVNVLEHGSDRKSRETPPRRFPYLWRGIFTCAQNARTVPTSATIVLPVGTILLHFGLRTGSYQVWWYLPRYHTLPTGYLSITQY